MQKESNGAMKGRIDSVVDVFKVVFRVLSVLALLITILAIFYTVLNPQGAVEIFEKLADITQTSSPTYTQQPTILHTELREVTQEVTREVTREVTSEVTVVVTQTPPSYSECGAVIFEGLSEKDVYGQNRPTKLWEENISNGPLTLAEVSACLVSDEGKKSDPGDIEEGYENKVVFYDIYGKPFIYRIIFSGRSLPEHASRDEMISADFGDLHPGFITYDEFEKRTQDLFKSRGSRQMIFQFYVTDNAKGHLSDFYLKIYPYSETYAQLVEAIKTGEGFPEEVPDGFFIWGRGARFYTVYQ